MKLIPVTRYMLLTKGDQIYLEVFSVNMYNQTSVREWMATDIHGKISLIDHEFLSYHKEGEFEGLC